MPLFISYINLRRKTYKEKLLLELMSLKEYHCQGCGTTFYDSDLLIGEYPYCEPCLHGGRLENNSGLETITNPNNFVLRIEGAFNGEEAEKSLPFL